MVKRILIIIPAFNEEENILQTYNEILNYNKIHKSDYNVIVINDGSTDATEKICNNNKIPTISLIHNLGIGGAVQTGYKYAYEHNCDIAVQFDADGQHDVNYIKTIIDPIIGGESDMVIGSRFIEHASSKFKSSFARRIGIKWISIIIKLVTGKRILDTTSGFRAVNKELIKSFAFAYPLEYPEPVTNAETLKKGYRIKEVAVNMHERQGGKSSIGSWKNIYYMLNVIISIFVVGTRRAK
ncbi:MAG: glycosyltransferase family 2 protein [Erysipelotrichaceae bacterium]